MSEQRKLEKLGRSCDPDREGENIIPVTFNPGINPRNLSPEQMDEFAANALGIVPCSCPDCFPKMEFTYELLRRVEVITGSDGTTTIKGTWVLKIKWKRICLLLI